MDKASIGGVFLALTGILAGLPHNDDNMWNAPGEFAHALRSTADPVDW